MSSFQFKCIECLSSLEMSSFTISVNISAHISSIFGTVLLCSFISDLCSPPELNAPVLMFICFRSFWTAPNCRLLCFALTCCLRASILTSLGMMVPVLGMHANNSTLLMRVKEANAAVKTWAVCQALCSLPCVSSKALHSPGPSSLGQLSGNTGPS